MESPIVKHSIVIGGHKTSVSLEDPFWQNLKEIAQQRRLTLSKAVDEIDRRRQHGNLSSAIRLFVLDHFVAQLRTFAQAEARSRAGLDDLASQHTESPARNHWLTKQTPAAR